MALIEIFISLIAMIGGFLLMVFSNGWFSISSQFSTVPFFRLCTDRWFDVTNGNILLQDFFHLSSGKPNFWSWFLCAVMGIKWRALNVCGDILFETGLRGFAFIKRFQSQGSTRWNVCIDWNEVAQFVYTVVFKNAYKLLHLRPPG